VETTERIVEAYVRYVRGWATIPNLRCAGQKEIDLFAIDPVTDERWHIETSVSISSGFSALTNEPFEPGEHKQRVKAAAARRKLGFFLAENFQPAAVEQRLSCLGCAPGQLRRAIVIWDWKAGVREAAAVANVELWSLPAFMNEIAKKAREGRAYFADDILRTIDLYARSLESAAKRGGGRLQPQICAPGLEDSAAIEDPAKGARANSTCTRTGRISERDSIALTAPTAMWVGAVTSEVERRTAGGMGHLTPLRMRGRGFASSFTLTSRNAPLACRGY
jgi:hypothetical protein